MPKKAAETAKKRKIAVGSHRLPKPIPLGEVITDCFKKEWKLGKPIGAGGFGLIYLTDVNSTKPVTDEAPYAMKLEPHANGPLFCELAFYLRVAKPELIKEWTQKKGLKNIGVPRYIASGNHTYNKEKYRFMVMDRCGTDLQKLFESNGRLFPEKTVFLLGIKLLYALEYIHDKEYVHADIKASNILTGFGKAKSGEVYLVDYGLAFKYAMDGKHKEYKEDPKRLHDGTIEFTSRDAHRGVAPSRRGDLEILGYCMLQWLCQKLPWEDKLSNKEYVKDSKIRYMNNIDELKKKCFPGAAYAKEFSQYLQYVAHLKYEERPDYEKCHAWFRQALKVVGGSVSDKLELEMSARKRPSDEHAGPPKKWRCVNRSTPETPRAKRQSRSTSRSPVKKPSSQKRPLLDAGSCNGMSPKVTTGRSPRVKSPSIVLPEQAILSRPNASSSVPHTKGAVSRSVSRLKKKATTLASASTQTSPGLRGLPRTCKRKIRNK